MKKRMGMALLLAGMLVAGGCDKVKKAEDNGAAEQQAEVAAQQGGEEQADEAKAGEEKTADSADEGGIPTVSDADLNPMLLDPEAATQGEAPAKFKAKFITSAGDFVIEFHRAWAPIGVDRAYHLIKADYYKGIAFFRTVPNFMVQFGIHANPSVSKAWENFTIKDDPVTKSNTVGMVTFAKRNIPDTRLTHLFINYRDNSMLDAQGFAPIGEVVEGMAVVERLYGGYGDGPPMGRGPDQGALTEQGNPYLQKQFPKLDYIKDVVILDEAGK